MTNRTLGSITGLTTEAAQTSVSRDMPPAQSQLLKHQLFLLLPLLFFSSVADGSTVRRPVCVSCSSCLFVFVICCLSLPIIHSS